MNVKFVMAWMLATIGTFHSINIYLDVDDLIKHT